MGSRTCHLRTETRVGGVHAVESVLKITVRPVHRPSTPSVAIPTRNTRDETLGGRPIDANTPTPELNLRSFGSGQPVVQTGFPSTITRSHESSYGCNIPVDTLT